MQHIKCHLHNLTEQYRLDYVARQALASIWYQQGDNVLLATVTREETPINEDFLPLSVQYLHKSYAIRKIPGGFMKREGKPSEFEILTSRIIDRSLRPLFPSTYRYPTHISVLVLSYDGISDLQVCALHAAANALFISPLALPSVSSVRIGKINNAFVINPTKQELSASSLDLYVSGSNKQIIMIEMKGSDKQLDEDALLQALQLAQNTITNDCKEFHTKLSPYKAKPLTLPSTSHNHTHIYDVIASSYQNDVDNLIAQMSGSERGSMLDALAEKLHAMHTQWELEAILQALLQYKRHRVRTMILKQGIRADGRRLDEVRAISIETNILPCAHASALFTRGQTQALVSCTLGGEQDAKTHDDFHGGGKEKFVLHYNFLGFSVGEASMIGAVGRREIGHGNLAKKALESSLPPHKHTIRLVSEILESNGSSSMASVCGGSLALRACGLDNELVGGVAMGLVKEGERYAVLSDIMGLEDHDGDMDCKIAGTRHAITAMQMDIKIEGISADILQKTLYQAKRARIHIIDTMEQAANNICVNANLLPKSKMLDIPGYKIPEIIGPSGKVIKEIIERFHVSIDINKEQEQILIHADNEEHLTQAIAHIQQLITPAQYAIGEHIKGAVKRVVDFGVFVSLHGGGVGLLHISKIPQNMQPVAGFFNEGDVISCVISGNLKGKIELALA